MEHKTDLRNIPGVGPKIEQALVALGYTSMQSLKNADPQELYERDCMKRGLRLDPCLLYVYRLAVYYVNAEPPDPEKCKWWYWKEENGPGSGAPRV